MSRFLFFAVVSFAIVAGKSSAQAQSVIWQQPAPVVWQQPAPVIWQQPAPVVFPSQNQFVVAQRPPVVVSSMPWVYRAPIVTYRPTRQTVTRYRPLLGRSVTRSRYVYR
jgi:hypothetical protein